MTIPSITPYVGVVPNRLSQVPGEFSENADNFATWWEIIGSEMNPMIDAINITGSQVSADAVIASDAAGSASESAGVCATFATGTNGTPLGDYADALTFANHDSYCRDAGKLYRLSATTAAGYVTNTAIYPTADLDPNLLESFNFTSAQNDAIAANTSGVALNALNIASNKGQISNKNLLTVSNTPKPFDNGVDTPPGATPTTFPVGYMVAPGYTVTTECVGLTYNANNEYSATSGEITIDYDDGLLDLIGFADMTASWSDSSGSPNTSGITATATGVVITFPAANGLFSTKLEAGTVATRHEINQIKHNTVTLVNAIGSGAGAVNEVVDAKITAAIGADTVKILTNPFGTDDVDCVAEMFINNRWGPVRWIFLDNVGSYGVDANFVDGIGIVIQSGSRFVSTNSDSIGGGHQHIGDLASAPLRIKVTRRSL